MEEHPAAKHCSSFVSSSNFWLLFISFNLFLTAAPVAADGGNGRVARPPQDPTLHGRVEQRNGVEKLNRPLAGQMGLNESVRILSGRESLNGQAMEGLTNAASKEEVLEKTLNSNNFELNTNTSPNSYQKLNPKSDWDSLSSASSTMRTSKRPCRRCPGAYMMYWERNQAGQGSGGPWDYGYGNWVILSMPGGGDDSWRLQVDKVKASLAVPQTTSSLFPDNRWQGNFPPNRSSFPQTPLLSSKDWAIAPVQPGPPASKPFFVDQNIGWDAWYKTISDALYKNWSSINSLPGEAKLRISVRPGRNISAEIISTDNFKPEFKSGLSRAVASLNGSAILDFPQASQRHAVSFDSVFTAGTKNNSGAYSERTNDIEHIKIRK